MDIQPKAIAVKEGWTIATRETYLQGQMRNGEKESISNEGQLMPFVYVKRAALNLGTPPHRLARSRCG
jgi:hypothetical protein